ncbi:hypothetical protein BAU15_08140 [Enterococcus sp. JM4C]|uniref:hypothetical protein n=1 Tax=Candidatus Enterococcus huntleyi TaxID=1857217 RepID=UPI00137AD221|nr:hypothetical protein [Enterococcus sp. JM4C]KAF1297865.1 hypothetical protein BAU15_08140 [Enterococcus sp. JM4C]
MSIGLYIVANEEFQEITRDDDFKTLDELLQAGYSKRELTELLKNMGIDAKEIASDEKVFYIDNSPNSLSFQIFKEDGETIDKYIDKNFKYCYEIFIEDLNSFYLDFSEYLKNYNFSYEIWKIREDLYEPENIKFLDSIDISRESLKMIVEDYSYAYPVVGRF